MAVCLWTRHRVEIYLDVELVTILHGVLTGDLSTIISNDDLGNVVPCYYISPNEMENFVISDGVECFCFYIHREMIDGYNDDFF